MSSRNVILEAVRKNKPQPLPMPVVPHFPLASGSVTGRFSEVLRSIGGQVQSISSLEQVEEWLAEKDGRKIIGIPEMKGYHASAYAQQNASDLEDVWWVVLKGELAVGENGAVWLDEKALQNRLLPFICQELVLVIDEGNIVDTMHGAYSRLRTNAAGYGLFIAGPSKTADIEQSLVIGAHGPLNLHLFIRTNRD